MSEIITVTPDVQLFDAAVAFADANTKYLGFFPRAAFQDAAAAGRLLVAQASDGAYLGHVLFWSLKRPPSRIVIQQVAVAPRARRRGVGRDLVEAVVERAVAHEWVEARCRRDFEATEFWSGIGFRPMTEKAGRGHEQKVITVFRRDLGHPHLFSQYDAELATSTTSAAIDMNVFVDLREARDNESSALMSDWLVDLASYWLADETWKEIDRDSDEQRRRRSRDFTNNFGRLDVAIDALEDTVSELTCAIQSNGGAIPAHSDCRQLAGAIAGGVDVFITRDDRHLLSIREIVEARFGVRVLSPAEFIMMIDELHGRSDYSPSRLAADGVARRTVRSEDLNVIAEAFVDKRAGERKSRFSAELKSAVAKAVKSGVTLLLEQASDDPIGVILGCDQGPHLEILVFRVFDGRLSGTVARCMVQMLIEESVDRGVRSIGIDGSVCSQGCAAALPQYGFVFDGNRWLKPCCGELLFQEGVSTWMEAWRSHPACAELLDELAKSSDGEGRPIAAQAKFERVIWPGALVDDSIGGYLIPIRPRWARELFDYKLVSRELFGVDAKLIFNCENAYYRSTQGPAMSVPARALWYVSSDGDNRVREVRAWAPIIDIVVDQPKAVYSRFKRLGVYSWPDVCEVARGDLERNIMAIQFGPTRLLKRGVPRAELGRIMRSERGSVPQLQTVTRVSTAETMRILESGGMDARHIP